MLITGIAGVPGYNALHYFRSLYGEQVIGIRQPTMWPLIGEGIVACEVEDAQQVDELWAKYQFASVLNCGGSCRLKSCELDPAMAHRVNVTSTENIIRAAVRHDAQIIHLSIDLVYSGREDRGYHEGDPPDPVTVYGAKMVEAERTVRQARPDACILRISLPMGISFNGHAGAIDWIASRFKQSKPATLYTDEARTPTYTDCMNRLFARLMARPIQGTFHAGGTRQLTLYQIAQIVNVVGGYDPDCLQGCLRIEAGPMPPRAGDVTMDSSKLADAIGLEPFDPWPADDTLVPTDSRWHYRMANQFAGSESAVHELLYRNPQQPGAVPPSRDDLWGNRFNQ
ncbi:dTDP-4-dehydrorhamnose reductase [Neorhodopirellula lusitana]|uniref:dTDP-4-dehydrorhamnose reductase n=2 Tax=Neorhodopirellula lusitana TaxID=445327 RepID=A0ABY1QGX6_9BACT|nr:dTDP-4-dehydrorhamnose reductase [Neorhodopirellula lusitana]